MRKVDQLILENLQLTRAQMESSSAEIEDLKIRLAKLESPSGLLQEASRRVLAIIKKPFSPTAST